MNSDKEFNIELRQQRIMNKQEGTVGDLPTNCEPGDKIRSIQIEQLDRGYIVRVGCATIAIDNKSELMSRMIAYLENPADTEKRYFEGILFNDKTIKQ